MTTQLTHPTATTRPAPVPSARSLLRTTRRRHVAAAAVTFLAGVGGLGAWAATAGNETSPAPAVVSRYGATELDHEGTEVMVAEAIARGIDPMTLFATVDPRVEFPVVP